MIQSVSSGNPPISLDNSVVSSRQDDSDLLEIRLIEIIARFRSAVESHVNQEKQNLVYFEELKLRSIVQQENSFRTVCRWIACAFTLRNPLDALSDYRRTMACYQRSPKLQYSQQLYVYDEISCDILQQAIPFIESLDKFLAKDRGLEKLKGDEPDLKHQLVKHIENSSKSFQKLLKDGKKQRRPIYQKDCLDYLDGEVKRDYGKTLSFFTAIGREKQAVIKAIKQSLSNRLGLRPFYKTLATYFQQLEDDVEEDFNAFQAEYAVLKKQHAAAFRALNSLSGTVVPANIHYVATTLPPCRPTTEPQGENSKGDDESSWLQRIKSPFSENEGVVRTRDERKSTESVFQAELVDFKPLQPFTAQHLLDNNQRKSLAVFEKVFALADGIKQDDFCSAWQHLNPPQTTFKHKKSGIGYYYDGRCLFTIHRTHPAPSMPFSFVKIARDRLMAYGMDLRESDSEVL